MNDTALAIILGGVLAFGFVTCQTKTDEIYQERKSKCEKKCLPFYISFVKPCVCDLTKKPVN